MKKQENTLGSLKISYLSIESLKENQSNARTHSDKQIAKIVKSVNRYGFLTPVLVDQDKMIIAGNGRVRAARILNIKEIPVIFIEHLSPAELKAYALADNRIAQEAGWDNEILKVELQYLMDLDIDFDVTLTGFEIPEIDIIVNDITKKESKPEKADILPEENKVPKRVKAGDLWNLGKHYLYCGDALIEDNYKILLGDLKANMILVDNPYNVPIDGHVCGSGKIKHAEFAMASGEMSPKEFRDFLEKIFRNLAMFSIDGSWHLHFMDWRHMREILSAGHRVYSELKNLCVWNKTQAGMGSMWRSQHELVFAFKNGTAPHVNNIELGKHGRYRSNLWDCKGISVTNPGSLEDLKYHPTVKPLALIIDAILDCSKPNDIILDCFAGSGTTLLACERTRRKAYVIEYEPKYCDVIIYRYEKLFGKKAELVGNYSNKEAKNG